MTDKDKTTGTIGLSFLQFLPINLMLGILPTVAEIIKLKEQIKREKYDR